MSVERVSGCWWAECPDGVESAPSSRLHDSRYLGETFRDRQTIQRRQARLRSRIDSMNALERHELLQWMQENYGNAEEAA